jgi:hypothetical protein
MNNNYQQDLHEMSNLLMEVWIILDRLTSEMKDPQLEKWRGEIDTALGMVKTSSQHLKRAMNQ